MKYNYLIFFFFLSYSINAQLGLQRHSTLSSIENSTNNPYSKLADIDNDGKLDIITSTSYGGSAEIKWFKNKGSIEHFWDADIIFKRVDFIYNPRFFFDVKDINGDGYADVVLADYYDNKIVCFQNNGQGGFGASQTIKNVNNPKELILTDIDEDGFIDILTALGINNERVSWYKNDGTGNFGNEITLSISANNVHHLKAEDINGDGHKDIFLHNSNGFPGTVWYENINGTGNFGSKNNIPTNETPKNISVVDFNGNGNLDILYSYNNNYVAWHENLDGLGTFSNRKNIFSLPSTAPINSLSAIDISGNGNMDIIIDHSNTTNSNDKIFWFENLGGNNFGPENIIIDNFSQAYIGLNNFNFKDIDNDGLKDFIFSSEHNVNALKNLNGQGDFGERKIINKHLGYTTSTNITNLNNNAYNDLITTIGNKTFTFKNNGTDFTPQQMIPRTSNSKVSDINGDGFEDLLIHQDNKLYWLENNGQGDFTNKTLIDDTYSAYNGNANLFIIDLNNNGYNDIIAKFGYDLVWFKNTNGLGNFGTPNIISTIGYYKITVGDVNNDNNIDILTLSSNGSAWLENDGQGNFASPQTIDSASANYIYADDLNNDGNIDIITSQANTYSRVKWYKNLNGQGTFDSPQTIAYNLDMPHNVYAADINNNGYKDIILSHNSKLVWFENLNGQGNFSSEKTLLYNANSNNLAFGDLLGNGKTDLITLFGIDYDLMIYENLGYLGNQIYGNIKFDKNNNGCNLNDTPARQILVTADNGSHTFSTFTQPNGDYYLETNDGNFSVAPSYKSLPTYFNVNPTTNNINFNGLGNSATLDFCLDSSQNINDLKVTIYPITSARPGFETEYQILYTNLGTTTLSGTIDFSYDNTKLNYLSATKNPISQTSNQLTFNYNNISAMQTRSINVKFDVFAPPTSNINDILDFSTTIFPTVGDHTSTDNSYTFQQTLVGSYDPNDIRVLEGEEIYYDEIDDYLHYIIRFQNTGTASAINVVVENELDENLEWNTFQVENFSHNNRVEIKDENQVKFIFEQINLPDSLSMEEQSHGFITYKIKPKSSVNKGDIINNTAAIYFDYNPPIITNTATTTIIENLGTPSKTIKPNLVIYPNPANSILNISTNLNFENVNIYNSLGQKIISKSDKNGLIRLINIENLKQGIYIIELQTNDNSLHYKNFVKD